MARCAANRTGSACGSAAPDAGERAAATIRLVCRTGTASRGEARRGCSRDFAVIPLALISLWRWGDHRDCPTLPRPVVVPQLVVADQVQREEIDRCAHADLAVCNDFVRRQDAARLVDLFQLVG